MREKEKEKEKEKEREKERFEKKCKAVLLKVVERRRKLGISQWDLGELLNLTSSGYFEVETGKTKLDMFRFFKILEKLEISPEDFFKGMK